MLLHAASRYSDHSDVWCTICHISCYFATCCLLIFRFRYIQIYNTSYIYLATSLHAASWYSDNLYAWCTIYCYFATCCILIFRFRYIQIYDVWYHIYLIIYTATSLHAASWFRYASYMHDVWYIIFRYIYHIFYLCMMMYYLYILLHAAFDASASWWYYIINNNYIIKMVYLWFLYIYCFRRTIQKNYDIMMEFINTKYNILLHNCYM